MHSFIIPEQFGRQSADLILRTPQTVTDLNIAFEAAVASTQDLTQRPDNQTLLKLYALYKQATEGDNATTKPGFNDLVGRAKWDAWAALKGTSADDAMRRYIDLIDTLE
jgi:diazepam-binding inhibitor (GABA receptor modulator, acyl-CoA-binding protein)